MSRNLDSGDLRLSRRQLLSGATAAAAVLPLALSARAQDSPLPPLLMPGPFRGKVVDVTRPDSVENLKINQDAVRAMMTCGLLELTGAKDEAAAWKRFFKPTDVVGIKVSPVGFPHAISQPETLLEIVRGLNLAGVDNSRIIYFNRYEDEYRSAGLDKMVPVGVRQAFSSPGYDEVQTRTDNYDLEHYVEFPRVMTGQDPSNPINRRSHLCVVVSQVVDKVINVCALKDHSSAGVTMALKNMSHGMNNNVCRTHPDAANNWCDEFIAKVAAQRRIREKVALHIGDGLIGCYDGGPGIFNKHFRTFEYKSLFFATDPVALDRIAWDILDQKRVQMGLPKLADSGRKRTNPGNEPFDYRQPNHVVLAGQGGLGESDLAKIQHKRIELKA
jgi:uncharacterized protein (DUF362 family)